MTAAIDLRTQPSGMSIEERRAMLSVNQLMWLRFRRNRLAVIGMIILIVMYTMAFFADFLAPYTVDQTHQKYVSTPPTGLQLFDTQGEFHWPPFVYGLQSKTDPDTFRRTYVP